MVVISPSRLPKVSIVIPACNGIEYTLRCLSSLANLIYPDYEIVLVDNASTDGTSEIVKQEYPGVAIVRTAANLGYAGGCNVGANHSKGDCVLFLNNDTRVLDRDLLEALVRVLYSSPKTGAVCPQVVSYDEHAAHQFSGMGDALGLLEISGVAFLIKIEAFKDVGMFDPSFFAYYEDRDLFARLKKAGWLFKYVPDVRVAHKGSATSRVDSPFYYYYHNRNLLLIMRRHMRFSHVLRNVFPVMLISAFWFMKRTIKTRDWKAARSWMKGYIDGAKLALKELESYPRKTVP